MTPDFFNLSYLKAGSDIQQKGAKAIQDLEIMDILKVYDPVLVGTLPLELFTNNSDLDILCYSFHLEDVEKTWRKNFGRCDDFKIISERIQGKECLIARFRSSGFRFELFAQGVPTNKQVAYIHLVNEFRLLEKHGKPLRDAILRLKLAGMKTEPAFAKALGLPGDPYEALLISPS